MRREGKLGAGGVHTTEDHDHDEVDHGLAVERWAVQQTGDEAVGRRRLNQAHGKRREPVTGGVDLGFVLPCIRPHGQAKASGVMGQRCGIARRQSQKRGDRVPGEGLGEPLHHVKALAVPQFSTKPLCRGGKSSLQRQDMRLGQSGLRPLSQGFVRRAFERDDAAGPEFCKTALQSDNLWPGVAALPEPAVAQYEPGLPVA